MNFFQKMVLTVLLVPLDRTATRTVMKSSENALNVKQARPARQVRTDLLVRLDHPERKVPLALQAS